MGACDLREKTKGFSWRGANTMVGSGATPKEEFGDGGQVAQDHEKQKLRLTLEKKGPESSSAKLSRAWQREKLVLVWQGPPTKENSA